MYGRHYSMNSVTMEIEENDGVVIFHLRQYKEIIEYDSSMEQEAFIKDVKKHRSASAREKREIIDFIFRDQKVGMVCPKCGNSNVDTIVQHGQMLHRGRKIQRYMCCNCGYNGHLKKFNPMIDVETSDFEGRTCPKCRSTNLIKSDKKLRTGSPDQKFKCRNCGDIFSSG